MRRWFLGAATCALASALSQGAWAQAAQSATAPSPVNPSTAPAPVTPPSAAAADNSPPPAVQGPIAGKSPTAEGVQLQEVVVTASRRSEDLQKSSLSVQAIGGQALTRQGISQIQNLATLVPGLNVATTGSYTQIFLRGIGDYSATPIAEGSIAVNLDQVYLSSPAAPAGNFYDLQRVEVLRGPQGTLYGRNASGGALNVVTNKPSFDGYHVDLTSEFGDYNLKKGEGAVNLPVSDTLALRAAFQVVDRDGYFSDGSSDDVHQSGRLEMLWKPTSKLSVLLSADYVHQGGIGAGAAVYPFVDPSNPYLAESSAGANARLLAAGPQAGPGKPLLIPNEANGFQSIDSGGVSADIEINLGPVTLSVIPAYRETGVRYLNYTGGFANFNVVDEPQKSVETRITSNGNTRLKYVAGFFYFNSTHDTLYGVDYSPRVTQTYINDNQSDTSYAAFGQATYSLTDQLRVIGGLRYTYESKTQTGLQNNLPLTAAPTFIPVCQGGTTPTVVPAPLAQLASVWSPNMCSAGINGDVLFHQLDYKAGLEYDISRHSMVYFTASTGFKAGGLYPSLPPNSFQPETLHSYELGSKNRFFNNRLQVNVDGFYWEYNNQQQNHVGPISPAPLFGFTTINAGNATLYGADISLQFLATRDDVFSLDVAALHTKYDSFEYNQLDVGGRPISAASTGCKLGSPMVDATGNLVQSLNCAGKPLVRSPNFSGTVGYQHTLTLGSGAQVILGARTQFSTGYYTAIDYIPNSEYQSGFTNTSADLTYQAPNGRWSATVYVKNLEDNAIVSGESQQPLAPGVFYATLQPPRTYGGRFNVHF